MKATLRMRRDLVQALIGFANKTQGGCWVLVNCTEMDRFTVLELECEYFITDLPLNEQPADRLRRFRVVVEPVYETEETPCSESGSSTSSQRSG